MRKLIPHFSNWTIDTNEQGDYIKYQTSTHEHHANFLGDGFISLFRICTQLISNSQKLVLIIDEPELSLHPSAQKALSSVLSEASANKQIVICTHSPYFANWQDLINGAKFIRMNKKNDEKCEAFALSNSEKYHDFIEKNIDDWQKPQLLDLVSKEILFSEKILFVEGQEDVGLLRKYLKDNNQLKDVDIFGYGVGGYPNINLFLKMAKDLGLHKVAAIYDNGPDSSEKFEEAKGLYPEYRCKPPIYRTNLK